MKRQKSAGWFMLIFGVIFALVGVVVPAVFISINNDYRHLQEIGIPTKASIQAMHVDRSTDSDGDTSYSYVLEYQYLANGKKISDHKSVAKALYDELSEGDSINIKFDPRKVSKNILLSDEPMGIPLSLLLGACFFLPGLLVAWLGLNQIIRFNWLSVNGTLAEGEITEIRNGNMTVNDVVQIQVKVKFNETEAYSENLDPKSFRSKVGDKIQIKYNPKNPKEFILV
jgi:hypothetical protein